MRHSRDESVQELDFPDVFEGRQPEPLKIGKMQATPDFRSFWMAGFEGADHINGLGDALDMAQSNKHFEQVDEDYASAAGLGLLTVRESIGWRLCEAKNGRVDLSRPVACSLAARRTGVQIIWSLMHYGTPDGVLVGDHDFVERFAAFAATVARTLRPYFDEPPIYNPINEIGFLSWAVSETNMIHPYRNESADRNQASGFVRKCDLVRAALAAMKAIKREDPRARFLHVEPVVHVVPPAEQPGLRELAEQIRAYQWQSWDLLCGRAMPELGGHPEALDLIGVNHYASGQWEAGTERRIVWHLDDPRWMPLSALLQGVWDRYRRPMIVSETSHVGSGRARWLDDVGKSAAQALEAGIDLRGVCLYPAVDRPDWSDKNHWHNSGLWDVELDASGYMQRRLHLSYAKTLRRWQRRLHEFGSAGGDRPLSLGCVR